MKNTYSEVKQFFSEQLGNVCSPECYTVEGDELVEIMAMRFRNYICLKSYVFGQEIDDDAFEGLKEYCTEVGYCDKDSDAVDIWCLIDDLCREVANGIINEI